MKPKAKLKAVTKSKRESSKPIDYNTKGLILKDREDNMSLKDIAAKYDLRGTSTVQEILNKREEIIDYLESGKDPKKFRNRNGKYEDLEDKLVHWILQLRHHNEPIDGTLTKEKAKEIAEELNLSKFQASDHWLLRFRKRHEIRIGTLNGEKASADFKSAEEWLASKDVQDVISKYDKKNIFNADETALFWRLMPSKSFLVKNDAARGGKKDKSRITILFTCNADGTKKWKPFVIGKSRNPRCFKGENLPTEYTANKTAWMTSMIFKKYLSDQNKELALKNRKILLLLDNFSGHIPLKLSHIEIMFLPPNTTSILQPLDLGIIRNFKYHYRVKLLKQKIANLEEGKGSLVINLYQALQLVYNSWKCVKPQTIENCFSHSKIIKLRTTVEEVFDDEVWQQFSQIPGETVGNLTFDEYIDIDSSEPVHEIEDLESASQNDEERDSGDDDEFFECDEEQKTISGSKALLYISELSNYFSQVKLSDDILDSLATLEQHVKPNFKPVQATIPRYFKPINDKQVE